MKKFVVILILFASLFIVSDTYAGDITVKVDIKQEGEGTSSTVKINGEEWKLEGPGEIHVDKTSATTPSPFPTPTELGQIPILTPKPETSTLGQILKRLDEIKEAISNFISNFFERN